MPVQHNPSSTSFQTTAEERLMERNFSGGDMDIEFDAYMLSKMGLNNETNSDNYYMNGIFMDNFKFMDLKKSISNCGESAVFAVSTGVSNDRASKLALRFLDQKREWIVSAMNISQVKQRLKQTIAFCNTSLLEEGQYDQTAYEAEMVVAVYFRDHIIYASNGKGMLILKRGTKVKNLASQNMNLGVSPTMPVKIGKAEIFAEDRVILCTRGVVENSTLRDIGYDIASESIPKNIAVKLAEKAMHIGMNDATCMAISAAVPDGIKNKTIIITVLCALWILINIIIMIAIE